jgi:cytidine deaminase
MNFLTKIDLGVTLMEAQLNLINEEQWIKLAGKAWKVRENSHTFGGTKVGCALLSNDGLIFTGCNVEHRFRSHDIHAETNAISSMIASGQIKIIAILVVAKRNMFTPCGACMDWIYQFGGPSCMVAYQVEQGGDIKKFRAADLMPFYPN